MSTLSKILVTGDRGFIGSHIKFEHDGFDILDGFDVTDIFQVKKLIPKYDCVVNLAAISDVDSCAKYTKKAYTTNVIGAINVLQHAKKVVFISSASIYEDSNHSVSEESPIFPKSYYGITKAMMESVISGYLLANPKPCVILRPFNITGNGSKGVTEIFKRDKELKIYGNPYRDFISVEDVCVTIQMAIDNIKNYVGEIFNVGTGKATSIRDLAVKSEKLYTLLPPKKNDIQFSCADISKIQKEWGSKI